MSINLMKRLEILQVVDGKVGLGTLWMLTHDKCHYFTKMVCIEKDINQVVLFMIEQPGGWGHKVIHSACWLGDGVVVDAGGVRTVSDIVSYYCMAGQAMGQEYDIFTSVLDLGRFDPGMYYDQVLDNSKEFGKKSINWLRALDDYGLLKGLC